MPIRGRQPKGEGARVSHGVIQHNFDLVEDVPHSPTLSQARCPVPDAHPLTRSWWRMVSTLPHASRWSEGDWAFARATAFVHEEFVMKRKLARELRDRERMIGTTEDARKALRIRYIAKDPQSPPAPRLEALPNRLQDERRRRLLAEEPGGSNT